MRENINKVSQRGERLDSLQDKTDNLAVSAQGFRRGANRVRKQMWWKDFKMRICLIVGIIILLVVIIVPTGRLRSYCKRTQILSYPHSPVGNSARTDLDLQLSQHINKREPIASRIGTEAHQLVLYSFIFHGCRSGW